MYYFDEMSNLKDQNIDMFKMKKTKRIGHVKQRKNFERIN